MTCFVFVTAALSGCATEHLLMPTPLLYTGTQARPLFIDLPVEHRTSSLDLLFITDRAQSKGDHEGSPYTAGRSRTISFGSTSVEFGDHLGWDALVRQSIDPQGHRLDLRLGRTEELGRFPPIPYEVVATTDGEARLPAVLEAHEKAKEAFRAEIERRLTAAPRKEVVLFVHGYSDSFEDAALTMGELCHFLGREFVCSIFSWPAGGKRGVLFGYDVDRESSEYAVEDLLKTIRVIAKTPGVQRIHLLAHSRGADTLATALSELSVEAYVSRRSFAQQFKIGNVVLMAPDIDADVALSKIFKVISDPDLPFGASPDPGAVMAPSPSFKITIYVSPDDKALATSGWLFGSIARLGRIDAAMLTPHEIQEASTFGKVDVIQVRGGTDFFGHSYFVSNPEVSADIIAMLRYGLHPNEPGRPLENVAGPFWRISPEEKASVSEERTAGAQ